MPTGVFSRQYPVAPAAACQSYDGFAETRIAIYVTMPIVVCEYQERANDGAPTPARIVSCEMR
jgi:hypothetical protein